MNLRDLVLVLTVCVVWGFNFVAGAKGVEALSPLVFMVLRFALVLAVTFPFLRRPPTGQWLRLASVCILIGGLHFTTLFAALRASTDVSSIVITQQTYIPMAVILAMVLLGEKAGWRTLCAIGIAFSGVLVLGFDPLVLGQLDALALALLSAFFQALGSVLMRGISGIGVFGFQAWSAVFSLPLLLAVSLMFEDGQLASVRAAHAIHWASLAYSTFLASLVGHGLFFFLVQRNPLPDLMPYLLLTPAFGVMFGILVWGDRPGLRLAVGSALVLTGILVVTLRRRHRSATLVAEPE